MKLKSIPQRLGYILGAQWTRDLSWTIFTILLARQSQGTLGQVMLALSYGYLVKTAADVGLNDFLLSSFARKGANKRRLLGEVSWFKLVLLVVALVATWLVTGWQGYDQDLRLVVLCIAAGFGLDGVSDSFFALCQARGRQDVEMRIRIPAALVGIGYGIACVLMGAPTLAIAVFKPLESILLMAFALKALGRNPLAHFGWAQLRDLLMQLRTGLIFTGMAGCAMLYNKLNVFFLKKYGGDAVVGGYSVAWETVEGLSVLVSGALLGKVIFPLMAKTWDEDRDAFRKLSGQTAKSLWAAALPIIFLIFVESDRFLTLVYGAQYSTSVTAQQLLTPCVATAFLHNLAAYAMISMHRHRLLFAFYLSGLVVNIICCFTLIPWSPLVGAALSLTITKVWVAIFTVGFFQATVRPMGLGQWCILLGTGLAAFLLWHTIASMPVRRELAELTGLIPLVTLFWFWRPPSIFDKKEAA
ncbi:polysaccharide biosynthesis protein [Desulfovibrio sp. An276]|uniref:oligosaccharide flippase family protein n=1 Tax=Desulfovibrio sp. An276 TaxID=1965618 RepID=UPI000B37B2BA|nr:oligosaccharide flippase family protein [Desulfovibrio sp. An276]OUO51017.1 polysaccharide biosynthesis protein [Desulfovibrio sp. An276]